MKKIFNILVIILLFSCSQSEIHEMSAIQDIAFSEAESKSSGNIPIEVEAKTKIIKDGRIGLEVADINKAKSSIDALVKSHNGYYESENLDNTIYSSTYNLKIRVPSGKFEDFVSGVESTKGKIRYKEINARDVTRQFIDLETRLENKQNYLTRYRELLKKANTIDEILSIERNISSLEEEIESTTKQLKYLSNQVDFSTLDIRINQEKEFIAQKSVGFFFRLKNSFVKGWSGFIDFTFFVVKFWPFLILVGIGIYFWRKRKKKNKS